VGERFIRTGKITKQEAYMANTNKVTKDMMSTLTKLIFAITVIMTTACAKTYDHPIHKFEADIAGTYLTADSTRRLVIDTEYFTQEVYQNGSWVLVAQGLNFNDMGDTYQDFQFYGSAFMIYENGNYVRYDKQ
jgi:hypothetical protein